MRQLVNGRELLPSPRRQGHHAVADHRVARLDEPRLYRAEGKAVADLVTEGLRLGLGLEVVHLGADVLVARTPQLEDVFLRLGLRFAEGLLLGVTQCAARAGPVRPAE